MMRFIPFIYSFLLLISCSQEEYKSVDVSMIAHAGGLVDGATMTNSLEALYSARDNGFRFIELDLSFTSDSMLVALHDWPEYNRAMGMAERGDSAASLKEFLEKGVPGGFTPLTSKEINDFFLENDNLFFVTDKVSDADVLERFFPKLRSRMMVEAFSYDDYTILLNKGYPCVMYSCMAKDIVPATLKHLLLHKFFAGPKIEMVALHTSAFDYAYLKFLRLFSDFDISLFTINNPEEIPSDCLDKLRFIYTDSLTPQNVAW
jgi:glycerophosphoryl diester phosphodiesterase